MTRRRRFAREERVFYQYTGRVFILGVFAGMFLLLAMALLLGIAFPC